MEHSLFNGHPRFMGFITSPAAPLGALGELLAAAVNPNVGGWMLSPMASEIEAQTIRWIAEMIGYPRDAGGILVTGGTMANFVAFLAARKAKVTWDARAHGMGGRRRPAAARLRFHGNPHLDSQGGGPVRHWDGFHRLGSGEFRPADGHHEVAREIRADRAKGSCPSW